MTNNEILEHYLSNGLIRRCVECQFAQLKDRTNMEDMFQDLCLILLEDPKLENVHNDGKMNAYVSQILIRQIFSKTSPYYMTYRRFQDRANNEITDDLADKIPDVKND